MHPPSHLSRSNSCLKYNFSFTNIFLLDLCVHLVAHGLVLSVKDRAQRASPNSPNWSSFPCFVYYINNREHTNSATVGQRPACCFPQQLTSNHSLSLSESQSADWI